METLKPCKFCGDSKQIFDISASGRKYWACIVCSSCRARTDCGFSFNSRQDAQDDAAENWNLYNDMGKE